jgi:integrase
VEHSLILRLFLRIPMRQRNMREMQLRRHLVQLPDGHWEVRFRGDDLKVGWRRGRVHELVYQFPLDLEGLLEEWLTKWRPLLIKAPDEPHVFVSKSGKPYTENTLWSMICRLTYKFTGVAVNPHMIRDIWATEYIKSTRDITGAAYMLGNTEQIILRHYAHLLDAEAEQKATQWLRSRLT